jgi:hypothetical protein
MGWGAPPPAAYAAPPREAKAGGLLNGPIGIVVGVAIGGAAIFFVMNRSGQPAQDHVVIADASTDAAVAEADGGSVADAAAAVDASTTPKRINPGVAPRSPGVSLCAGKTLGDCAADPSIARCKVCQIPRPPDCKRVEEWVQNNKAKVQRALNAPNPKDCTDAMLAFANFQLAFCPQAVEVEQKCRGHWDEEGEMGSD